MRTQNKTVATLTAAATLIAALVKPAPALADEVESCSQWVEVCFEGEGGAPCADLCLDDLSGDARERGDDTARVTVQCEEEDREGRRGGGADPEREDARVNSDPGGHLPCVIMVEWGNREP